MRPFSRCTALLEDGRRCAYRVAPNATAIDPRTNEMQPVCRYHPRATRFYASAPISPERTTCSLCTGEPIVRVASDSPIDADARLCWFHNTLSAAPSRYRIVLRDGQHLLRVYVALKGS